jgi:hypothetical protein
MLDRKLMGFGLVIVLALILVPIVSAKGLPAKVTITGPDQEEEIAVTDPDLLENLGMGTFPAFWREMTAAPQVGAGYELVRYFEAKRGTFRASDRLSYYPDPSGGPGYIHCIGVVEGWSEYDGKWFLATTRNKAAIQSILAENGMSPETQHVGLGESLPLGVMVAGVALVLLLAIVSGTRRRAVQTVHAR